MDRVPTPLRLLVSTPASISALVAVAVMINWTRLKGGYPAVGPTRPPGSTDPAPLLGEFLAVGWYPGAIFLVGLLAAGLMVLPGRLRDVPRPVLVAGACLVGFTVWSYASIAWADQPGEAWDGANRTLLYLVVFCLFAAWAQRGASAALVLGVWTVAMIVLATVVLVRLPDSDQPLGYFIAVRLAEPAGYPNAAAATWLMAVWPALVLAGRVEVPALLRGLFAAGAVLLADLAALSQSRGSFYSLPVVVILFFVLVPGRVRSLVVFVPVAIALALTVPGAFEAIDRLREGADPGRELEAVARATVIAALAVGALVGLGAAVERLVRVAPSTGQVVHRSIGAVGLGGALVLVVVALVLAGDPLERADSAWASFKRGPVVVQPKTGSRLSAGLGSNRYDFYRVALQRFGDRPLTGIGADNFFQPYLRYGRSNETPRYPHSLEFRTLAQTGIVGALLLLGAVAAALLAVVKTTRRPRPLGGAVAGAAAMVFVYWAVHGSFDWFWEFAGLGAPAFAMLGLGCALVPRPHGDEPADRRPILRGRLAIAAGAVVAVVAVASLALPWIAQRNVQRASRTWASDPSRAFQRLDQAASLNPLSERPQLAAGTIALRLGDLDRAERSFRDALSRDPRSVYANLELGAIAYERGDRARAQRLLDRARALHPRNPFVRDALDRVKSGRKLNIAELNEQIRSRTNQLVR